MNQKTGKAFIEGTKYHNMAPTDQARGLPQPPLELAGDRGRIIDLPAPDQVKVNNISLREAIEKRKSLRIFSDKPLKLEELSYLLWCTQGVKKVIPGSATFRTVPSAGARHCLETYLLINRVRDLPQGVYRFLAQAHKLIEISTAPELSDRTTEACLGQDFVRTSATTFIWSAVAYRMTWRYGERGYRYMYLDAGHVCQNLYLSAEDIDCGVCAIGAFSDDELNRVMGFDGEKQFAIYAAALGKR